MKDENITALITALRSETAAGAITPESLGSLLQKIVDAIPTTGGLKNALPVEPRYKITAEVEDEMLYIRGDLEKILEAGYLPYLFRWSIKHNRLRNKYTRMVRYSPNRKGWHPFFRYGKIKIGLDGMVTIYKSECGQIDYSEQGPVADLLFERYHYEYHEDSRFPYRVNAPFGRRMVDCYYGHRFKFGIGFAPAQTGVTFDFSTLVTNIAQFHVYVVYDYGDEEAHAHYCL